MNESRIFSPGTNCNIPMPEGVKPPRSSSLCDSCVHLNVCRYSKNMIALREEVAAISARIDPDIFEVSLSCKHRKPNAVLR